MLMYVNRSTYRSQPPKRSKHPILLALALVIIGVIIAVWLNARQASAPEPVSDSAQQSPSQSEQAPAYTPINLQPIVEAWDTGQAATYGIVVYDVTAKKTIASTLPDEKFFAASLYKMFVAYLSLLDIQNGDLPHAFMPPSVTSLSNTIKATARRVTNGPSRNT